MPSAYTVLELEPRVLRLEMELEETKKHLSDLEDLVKILIQEKKDNLRKLGKHYLATDIVYGEE